ncbi:hypothetical protein [Hymenobacter metallilatus]|uniref:Uncharacterized protein n=1 Tax=Hymenobacter metallilatus TaxID=2493666 RepID=A0A3R9NEV5_9BACT|nr:hypothetical protein [Hymenobacter metallilatus]RSK32521.1 hypothetical protein EI290_12390 [Hymenobacter metallilatus]
MKNLLKIPAFIALLLVSATSFLSSCVATVPAATTVVVRPRPAYRPYYRPYYRPAPVVVAPRPIIVAPAPRPYYNYRPHRYYRVR